MKLKLVKESEKPARNPKPKAKLDDELDALFRLPLAEFTDARNILAARLKKEGRRDDAALVKSVAKPPVSAWAVNQLYWNYRDGFDRLIASGERVHKTQASGKAADMRGALEARREALTELSDLATRILREGGANPGQSPSLDIIRRITSTLEAMSVYASRADAPRPGRLTEDVDPPGFESLASWASSASVTQEAGAKRQAAGKAPKPIINSRSKVTTKEDARRDEDTRKAKVAAAKVSLQDAKRSLGEAKAKAQSLKAAHKKAEIDAKKADQLRRNAEEELRKAKVASEAANRLVRSVAVEIAEAEGDVDDAESIVDKASKELEELVRGS